MGLKKTEIKSVIFSDGNISSYEIEDGTLVMHFRDYNGYNLRFKFYGNLRVEERGSVGAVIDGSTLRSSEGRSRLEIYNDDLVTVFAVMYDNCTVEEDT